jgi:hypothetical protein
MSTRIRLKRVRLAFGQGIFVKSKPKGASPEAPPKYSCSLLLDRNDPQVAELQKIITAEFAQRFGPKAPAVQKAAEAIAKVCLRDGDLKSDYEGFADHWALSCSAFTKPSTLDNNRNEVTQESGILYSGCYVNAIVTIKAYDNVSKGASAEINGVQFAGKGDAFSGGRPAGQDEFEDEITDTGEAGSDPLLG